MRILVTGGAGLIGHLVSLELHRKGHDVLVFDNLSCYVDPCISNYYTYVNHRIGSLKGRVRIQRGDIRNRQQLTNAFGEFQPHVVIHLAAVADSQLFNTYSEEATSINLNGTINTLEAIQAARSVQRFVFASSSFVYGDFQCSPVDEEHPTSPKDLYGGTKLSGETLTRAFSKRFGFEYTILRPSAVYGPTDSNRRVSQIFIESALGGVELILEGGAENRLDFTYVEDTAQGFVRAALETAAANECFNITYGESRTLKEYVDIVRRYIPQISITEKPADPNRPTRGTLDISKARKLLGYQPRYDLEKGIEKYVGFVLERKDLLNL